MNSSTPVTQYINQAFAVLTQAGIAATIPSITDWLTKQYQAGVTVGDIPALWTSPDNADVVRRAECAMRLEYVGDEIRTRVHRTEESLAALGKKVTGADDMATALAAAEKAEAVVDCSVKNRVFKHYAKAIAAAAERGEKEPETFERLSHYAYRELASKAAAATSQSTSWQANAEARAHLAALGEIAGYFLDVSKPR